MAKSDTVHKCDVMDFFAYESDIKRTNIILIKEISDICTNK